MCGDCLTYLIIYHLFLEEFSMNDILQCSFVPKQGVEVVGPDSPVHWVRTEEGLNNNGGHWEREHEKP